MKIIKTPCPSPQGRYYEDNELDGGDFQRIEEAGFDLCVYWYQTGDYCGRGELLARKDGRYYHHDMCHCSCYGPTTYFDTYATGFDSLDLLVEACTTEEAENIRSCVETIRKYEKGEL